VVIKKDDTLFWQPEIQAKAKTIWTVCLVDLTQPTNLCEAAISYPYDEIKHFFDGITKKYDNEEAIQEIADEHEYAELSTGYFRGDSVFIVAKEYTDERTFDEAFENENCNPCVC